MKSHCSIVSMLVLTLLISSCRQPFGFIPHDSINFPENISPIYFVDTIHLDNPKCIEIRDTIRKRYIVPKSSLDTLKASDLDHSRSVLRLLDFSVMRPPEYHMLYLYEYKSFNNHKGFRLFTDNLLFDFSEDCTYELSLDSMKVYSFINEPEAFLISLAPKQITRILDEDIFEENYYSNEYFPCVSPIFSKRILWQMRHR